MVVICSLALNQATAGNTTKQAVLMMDTYPTQHSAALHASRKYNPMSIRENTEYAGAIYSTPKGFMFSVAKGTQNSTRLSITLKNRPITFKLVALWHSHGKAGPLRHYFSHQDMETSKKTNLPVYMISADNTLRIIYPTSTNKFHFIKRDGDPHYLFTGDVVVHDIDEVPAL